MFVLPTVILQIWKVSIELFLFLHKPALNWLFFYGFPIGIVNSPLISSLKGLRESIISTHFWGETITKSTISTTLTYRKSMQTDE